MKKSFYRITTVFFALLLSPMASSYGRTTLPRTETDVVGPKSPADTVDVELIPAPPELDPVLLPSGSVISVHKRTLVPGGAKTLDLGDVTLSQDYASQVFQPTNQHEYLDSYPHSICIADVSELKVYDRWLEPGQGLSVESVEIRPASIPRGHSTDEAGTELFIRLKSDGNGAIFSGVKCLINLRLISYHENGTDYDFVRRRVPATMRTLACHLGVWVWAPIGATNQPLTCPNS